jgi:predicted Holliday junction resolvase-like endonuclease
MSPALIVLLVIVAVAATIVALVFALRYGRLQSAFQARVHHELDAWRRRELGDLREQLESVVRREAAVQLEQWKAEHTIAVRQDAVQRSQSVTAGKVFEQLVPYLPSFRFNPKDARFLGAPVDFLVFDGLADDRCERVVFVEVKTGSSSLSTRERRVRDAINERRVEWQELRIPEALPAAAPDSGHGAPALSRPDQGAGERAR